MNKRDLLIWAAGFFDGEGCVNIARCVNRRSNSKGEHTYVCYQLAIIAAQKTPKALENFVSLFGGKLNSQLCQGKFIVWNWKVTGQKAADALVELLPYLYVKRTPAEIGLRCYEISASWKQNHRRNEMYPEELKSAQEMLWQQLKAFNSPNDVSESVTIQ